MQHDTCRPAVLRAPAAAVVVKVEVSLSLARRDDGLLPSCRFFCTNPPSPDLCRQHDAVMNKTLLHVSGLLHRQDRGQVIAMRKKKENVVTRQ